MKCKSCEGPIKDKLTKIYDAAEGFRNKNNSHSDQMKIWIEKIKVKGVSYFDPLLTILKMDQSHFLIQN